MTALTIHAQCTWGQELFIPLFKSLVHIPWLSWTCFCWCRNSRDLSQGFGNSCSLIYQLKFKLWNWNWIPNCELYCYCRLKRGVCLLHRWSLLSFLRTGNIVQFFVIIVVFYCCVVNMLKIRWRILQQETRFSPDLYWMIDMIAGNKMSQNWGF